MDRRRRSLITGTWRNSFADKNQKDRDLQKFDRVEELICDRFFDGVIYDFSQYY
jgi:hypothetical protein